MRKNKALVAIVFLVAFSLLNISALLSNGGTAEASGTSGGYKWSAGNWINDQNGNHIGCQCPVNYGDCLCKERLPDTPGT